MESAEMEKETKRYYDSIIGSREDLPDENNQNEDNTSKTFSNEFNYNSNLMSLNRKSSI